MTNIHKSKAITVTFDSNVWESIVDEKKRIGNPVYESLCKLIKNGQIRPFLYGGILTQESIKKKERKDFFKKVEPRISTIIDGKESIINKGTCFPGLHEYLQDIVKIALEMGFRFTHTPRIGAFRLPEKLLAKDENFDLENRIKRTFEFVHFLEGIGCGFSSFKADLGGKQNNTLSQVIDNCDKISDKKFASGIAEWVDGDALAAHYGYGFDFFCTQDFASTAGIRSVFHPNNIQLIRDKYNIKITTPEGLVNIISQY